MRRAPCEGMRHARAYAVTGALLGLGAPVGLLVLRHRRIREELAGDPLLYGYVTAATVAVFASFGWVLGRNEDRFVAAHTRLDQLREEMTAIVAHDLRGPIQALGLQTELLLRAQTGNQVQTPVSALERIARATGSLARMVDDLLDASRVESGRLSVDPVATDLGAATTELVERMRPTLGGRALELRVAPGVPRVRVDPQRLDQILTNLLQNAGKYSEPGTPIRIGVDAADGGGTVCVEDRGPGIAPDELPHLFERYYQTERARARRSGLGLGLYIAKGLVDAHGGRLTAESTVGVGSRFCVWLPEAR